MDIHEVGRLNGKSVWSDDLLFRSNLVAWITVVVVVVAAIVVCS